MPCTWGKTTIQNSSALRTGSNTAAAQKKEEKVGKEGAVYKRRDGLCLETQYFPDTVHHDNFPTCVFEEDQSVTVYQF